MKFVVILASKSDPICASKHLLASYKYSMNPLHRCSSAAITTLFLPASYHHLTHPSARPVLIGSRWSLEGNLATEMAASMSKTMRLSSLLKVDRDALSITRKQGIVSVLGSDHSEKTRGAASLRRTLSADMSSQKWLAENSFSPAKNTASSEEFPVLQEEEDELSHGENEEVERDGESEIWSKIQEEKQKKNSELGKASDSDLWTSILSLKEKNESSSASLPTYIHSLVNRSKSCLSLRSLEICTERLGSETDSDMVSSYPSSKTEVCDEEKGQQEQGNNISGPFEKEAEFEVAKYSCSPYTTKSSSPKSFPPPLPFLSRDEGGSMHMQSRRENGRLVLEAVSVVSQTNLIAQREDGRLVLTYVNDPNFQELENEVAETEVGEDVFDEEFNDFENDEDDDDREEEVEEEEEEEEIKNKKIESSAAQPWTFPNPNKFSEVDIEEGNGEVWGQLNQLPHSLPPLAQLLAPPSTVAVLTSSLNGNENWLRKKPLEETCEGKVVAPFIGGCKEIRRSLLCWETRCIATS